MYKYKIKKNVCDSLKLKRNKLKLNVVSVEDIIMKHYKQN